MDNVLVINLTKVTQHVGVVHADGKQDHVQIMPRRRVHLRAGMTVDPSWVGRNPGAIQIHLPVPKVAVALRAEPSEPAVVRTKPEEAQSPEGAAE